MNDQHSRRPGTAGATPTGEVPTGLLPTVVHTYQNHTLDSTLWQRFTPRDDDIVVATS